MKKFLTGIITAILALGSVQSAYTTPNIVMAEDSPLTDLVRDYEDINELYKDTFFCRFGAVDINTNKQFVTSGNSSAKLEVYGDFSLNANLTSMRINLVERGKFLDFSKLKSFTLDIFNQTNKEQRVGFKIGFDNVENDYEYQVLKVGKNQITYAPELSGISIAGDLKKGKYLQIELPKLTTNETTPNVFYLDNVKINYSLIEVQPLEITLDANELCSFDKYYQTYIARAGGVGPTEGCRPFLSINSDPEFCKNNTGKSLKAVLPVGTAPMNDGWPTISFLDALWNKIDLTAYANQRKYLVFDVYNVGSSWNFGFEVWAKDKKSVNYGLGFTAISGQWVEVRVPLAELNKFMETADEDSEMINLTDNYSRIMITYCKFDNEEKVVYFDNFRFE